ncbi:related to pheromone processing carboxypeptidase (Sxa2) [Rhynchosporium graminicola]|uniref:Related to pheromone processing carboxypeptidase (Sxa2) n=1 Tax=Rhynchosporium graminicola TaxID=2792576 RepID=A0A1E1LP68_9HELO|nr:related to pheromone processing carboxypeptidase (Sxa2) [Rhynchosporium commune]
MAARVLRLSLALLAVSTLVPTVFGDVGNNRFIEINRQLRKTKNDAKLASQRLSLEESAVASSTKQQYRFLNNDTKKYLVNSLPLVKSDIGEMYSGNIPIDTKDPSRTLFFIFQPTVGPKVDEVTIWLNGGPGCSSLIGFFQENGKFLYAPGMYEPILNEYSYVNLTNVLWVEQPVGTGYSTGNVTARNEADVGRDFADFFLNFQKTFGIKKFKIYFTGESYAGMYIPHIANEFLDRNDTDHFDVGGALIIDPCIGDCDYSQVLVPAVPYIQKNNLVFGLNDTYLAQLVAQDQKCGFADYRKKYLVFPPSGRQPPTPKDFDSDACDLWSASVEEILRVNPCASVYNILEQCPYKSDIMADPYPDNPIYFARADVKKALHAPEQDWSECAPGGVFVDGDHSLPPNQKVLPRLIEHTNRVVVTNGDLDYRIFNDGVLLAIQNMTWNGKMGFQAEPSQPVVLNLPLLQWADWDAANGNSELTDGPQGTMGTQHYERGLLWVRVNAAGHEQPLYQPRMSYRQLQYVLGRIDKL